MYFRKFGYSSSVAKFPGPPKLPKPDAQVPLPDIPVSNFPMVFYMLPTQQLDARVNLKKK
jgi:hypothetical protein